MIFPHGELRKYVNDEMKRASQEAERMKREGDREMKEWQDGRESALRDVLKKIIELTEE